MCFFVISGGEGEERGSARGVVHGPGPGDESDGAAGLHPVRADAALRVAGRAVPAARRPDGGAVAPLPRLLRSSRGEGARHEVVKPPCWKIRLGTG